MEEKNRDTIAGIPVSEWQVLVEDSLFGLFVEQVHLVQVESNLGLILDLSPALAVEVGSTRAVTALPSQFRYR